MNTVNNLTLFFSRATPLCSRKFLCIIALAINMFVLLYSNSLAQDTIETSFTPGSQGHQAAIDVENTSEIELTGVKVTSVGSPKWVKTISISPNIISLKPSQVATFTISFSISENAIAGESETIIFRVSAGQEVAFDHPDLELTITIQDHRVKELVIVPSAVNMNIDQKQEFSAKAKFDDHTEKDVSEEANWDNGNTFTAKTPGNFTVTATYQGISGSASITVAEPLPTAIEISPSNSTIKINRTVDFTATVTFDNGHTETNPDGISWNPGSSFTSTEAGEYAITAEYKGKSGSATVTVEEPIARAIKVSPSTITIMVDETVSFSAIAQFDVGDPKDVTGEATWSPGPQFKGVEAGKYTVTAEYKGISGFAEITVQNLYGDAKAALQSCDFEKGRGIIDQMLAGAKKSELEDEYEQKKNGYDKATSLFEEARGIYKTCDYDMTTSTLNRALNESHCAEYRDFLSQKISKAEQAKKVHISSKSLFEVAQSLYSSCEYEDTLSKLHKAVDTTPCDSYRDFLSEKVAKTKAAKNLADKLKAMVEQARSDYRSCYYDEALVTLNNALSQAKCSKHVESLNKKISTAQDRKAYEATTRKLHEEAKNLYRLKDYDGALARLQQAYTHTKCDRYKDNLSSMIAKVKGKRQSSPEEQVAALDCSRYGEAEAYWNASTNRAECRCKSGYGLNGNTCVPTRETLVQNLDCSVYPNTYAAWDSRNNRAACFCINSNYKWRKDGKGCIPKSANVVQQQNPMCPAAVYVIKNKLRSGDSTGVKLLANNAKSMGCTDPVIDQVLSGGGTGGGTGGGGGGTNCVCPPGTVPSETFGQSGCINPRTGRKVSETCSDRGTGGGGGSGDCSQCRTYEKWLQDNSRACGYHGNRLPSICELDPECIRWNKECNRVKHQLRECLGRCQ